jgi:hypothetical protein
MGISFYNHYDEKSETLKISLFLRQLKNVLTSIFSGNAGLKPR